MASEKSIDLMFAKLQRLHATSDRPADDQWFSRREIAVAYETRNGRATDHLNPARKEALAQLVARGLVEERVDGSDALGTKLYRIAPAASANGSRP